MVKVHLPFGLEGVGEREWKVLGGRLGGVRGRGGVYRKMNKVEKIENKWEK